MCAEIITFLCIHSAAPQVSLARTSQADHLVRLATTICNNEEYNKGSRMSTTEDPKTRLCCKILEQYFLEVDQLIVNDTETINYALFYEEYMFVSICKC